MAENALGLLVRRLREKRGLALREVGTLSGVDHAYIYRLESGAREAPSDKVLSKLTRTLKATPRETAILSYVASHPDIDPALIEYSLSDESVTLAEIAMASGAVYRGPVQQDYARLIQTMRRILEEDTPDE
jgi:transcriptional regulator with XRE-family HTH domain